MAGMGGMETLKVGDWVRTPAGHEGKIVLLYRMSAIVDYGNASSSGPSTCLLSELAKIDPPNELPK